MVSFNKRTIWGNIHCQNQLIEFRNNVVDYFNNCRFDEWNNEIHEDEKAMTLRSNLNQNLLNIQEIVHCADVATHLIYTPPAMIGGYRQNIDVISNIFNSINTALSLSIYWTSLIGPLGFIETIKKNH